MVINIIVNTGSHFQVVFIYQLITDVKLNRKFTQDASAVWRFEGYHVYNILSCVNDISSEI